MDQQGFEHQLSTIYLHKYYSNTQSLYLYIRFDMQLKINAFSADFSTMLSLLLQNHQHINHILFVLLYILLTQYQMALYPLFTWQIYSYGLYFGNLQVN